MGSASFPFFIVQSAECRVQNAECRVKVNFRKRKFSILIKE